MKSKITVLFALAAFLVSAQASAANTYRLGPEQKLEFESTVLVAGSITGKILGSLTGWLRVEEKAGQSTIESRIILSNLYTDSGIPTRDEHIQEMMGPDIELKVNATPQRIKENLYAFPVQLTWNDITEVETAIIQIQKENANTIVFSGMLKVKRSRYGIQLRDGHRFLNNAVDDEVKVKFGFEFISTQDM